MLKFGLTLEGAATVISKKLESLNTIKSGQRTTTSLTNLQRCTDLSVLVLFAYIWYIQVFSRRGSNESARQQ